MPCRWQAAASSCMGSRWKGVASTMLYLLALELNMAKPSWCLAVITMYFMPGILGDRHPLVGVEPHGLNSRRSFSYSATGILAWFMIHSPMPGTSLPFHCRREARRAPVDEHAEAGIAPPLQAPFAFGIGEEGAPEQRATIRRMKRYFPERFISSLAEPVTIKLLCGPKAMISLREWLLLRTLFFPLWLAVVPRRQRG